MRVRKKFYVIAYDTASAKRRRMIIKLLEPYGKRINYSVYECMLTESQLSRLVKDISKFVVAGKDQVAMYRICLDCYAHITNIPEKRHDSDIVVAI